MIYIFHLIVAYDDIECGQQRAYSNMHLFLYGLQLKASHPSLFNGCFS